MKRFLLAALLALVSLSADAQVSNPPTLSSLGGLATNASNAVLPTARNNLGIYIYTPTDYGAKCDSNGTTGTDDAAAINAMFTAIRAAQAPFRVTSPQNKTCFISSTINMTGLDAFASIRGIGPVIEMRLDCATNGTPCVDALSSRWLNFEHLYIHGEASNAPSYGIQIGRISAASADLHHFNRPIIWGNFTKSPFYNFASETVTFIDPFFQNNLATGTTYGLIQDGYNHFNITSAFVTQTAAVDTPQSFNENTFIGGWYESKSTTGAPFWLGNTARHKFIGVFGVTASNNCVDLYQTGAQANINLEIDLHCEGSPLTDNFLVTGPQTAPILPGFRYRSHADDSSNSVFKLDTGVVSVTAADFDVRVTGFAVGGNAVKLFNDASAWTVGGHVALPNIGNWTQPANFTGDPCVASVCDNYKNRGGALSNTASGNGSMAAAVSGINNTAYGFNSLTSLTSGSFNTAFGQSALGGQAGSNGSSAFGNGALVSSTGALNDAFGSNAGEFISSGTRNAAFGNSAMLGITGTRITGADNSAFGNLSLTACQGACQGNSTFGSKAGQSITTGTNNTILGVAVASTTLTTGTNNVLIGTTNNIDTAAGNTSNTIQVGAGSTAVWAVTGAGTPTTAVETFHGDILLPEVTTGTNADFLCMAAGNKLTLQTSACTISSMRFKDLLGDYKAGGALDTVAKLEPIVFQMKPGEKPNPDTNYGRPQIGLSAENVAAIEPRCAIYEDDGVTPKSYRQECLIAVLVAGMQAQQREIEALKAR